MILLIRFQYEGLSPNAAVTDCRWKRNSRRHDTVKLSLWRGRKQGCVRKRAAITWAQVYTDVVQTELLLKWKCDRCSTPASGRSSTLLQAAIHAIHPRGRAVRCDWLSSPAAPLSLPSSTSHQGGTVLFPPLFHDRVLPIISRCHNPYGFARFCCYLLWPGSHGSWHSATALATKTR